GFDTAWIDFTKGLGAPVGAVLAGSGELIEGAWRWKQMLGGALRQSGILAAACLYALDNNVDRLAEDHEHARMLADGLAARAGARGRRSINSPAVIRLTPMLASSWRPLSYRPEIASVASTTRKSRSLAS